MKGMGNIHSHDRENTSASLAPSPTPKGPRSEVIDSDRSRSTVSYLWNSDGNSKTGEQFLDRRRLLHLRRLGGNANGGKNERHQWQGRRHWHEWWEWEEWIQISSTVKSQFQISCQSIRCWYFQLILRTGVSECRARDGKWRRNSPLAHHWRTFFRVAHILSIQRTCVASRLPGSSELHKTPPRLCRESLHRPMSNRNLLGVLGDPLRFPTRGHRMWCTYADARMGW